MRRVMDSFDYSLFLGYKGHICGNRIVSSVYSQPLGCQHKCAHLQTRSPEGSFGSTLVNNSQGSIPTPTTIPPVQIVAGVEIRRQANPKGGPQTKWRRVPSRGRVCSVVLQRAPLKRSIPRLALPWLPPPTTPEAWCSTPLQHDSAPHLHRPPHLALAPM